MFTYICIYTVAQISVVRQLYDLTSRIHTHSSVSLYDLRDINRIIQMLKTDKQILGN